MVIHIMKLLAVPSTPTMILNSVEPLGFFSMGNTDTTFITDLIIKQPDVMVKIKEISGEIN